MRIPLHVIRKPEYFLIKHLLEKRNIIENLETGGNSQNALHLDEQGINLK